MLSLSTAIIRRVLPGLSEGAARADGIKSWMVAGSYFVDQPPHGGVALRNGSLDDVVIYSSFDFERFALASVESLLDCAAPSARPKAAAWPLIRAYYSAFFGAHAVLRAVGKGMVHVDRQLAEKIRNYGLLFAPNFSFAAANYTYKIAPIGAGRVDVIISPLLYEGGSHEQLWKWFYEFLEELSVEVAQNNEIDAGQIVADISSIQGLLASNGFTGGHWLSNVRNQINYQHAYGVWFPYPAGPLAGSALPAVSARASDAIRLDLDARRSPLSAFLACCQVIAGISCDVANSLAGSDRSRRFKRMLERLGT